MKVLLDHEFGEYDDGYRFFQGYANAVILVVIFLAIPGACLLALAIAGR